NEVTQEAMAAFMEHLERIVAEAPPQEELINAQRYLSDSFPLDIETAGRIASMVEALRVFGLPDDYWGTYRTSIRAVSPEQAHEAAREYIHPEQALIVAVGHAADRPCPTDEAQDAMCPGIVQPLRHWGPVRVIDTDGAEIARFPAIEGQATASAQE